MAASGRTYDLGQINLKHDRDFVEIMFAAINFTAPELVNYRYRIKGIDPEWQYTNERVVKYPFLPSGDYTSFEVQARNQCSGAIYCKLRFAILNLYWMTWWFIGILLMIVFGIILLIYRNNQAQKMIDIERMRVRIAMIYTMM